MDLSFIPSLKPLYQPFLDRGHEIYLVGGAVRDLLLGKPPKDFDFTTDAAPEKVIQMFRRTVPTGIKHGTVTVMLGEKAYEVTTFRTEGDYVDHRRPKEVVFTPSLEEDLKRRDFTINGLALRLPSGEVADFHGGESDLNRGIIRAIGRPSDRFEEDALRILRACRFAARLNFTLDPDTWEAIKAKKNDLRHLSSERVRDELNKTTASGHPGYGWKLLRTAGLLPELGLSLPAPLKSETLEALLDSRPDLSLPSRWALILRASAPQPDSWMKKMTFSNQEVKEVQRRLKVASLLSSGRPPGGAGQVLWVWGSRHLEDLKGFLACEKILEGLPDELNVDDMGEELERKAASEEGVFLKDLAIQGEEVMGLLHRQGGPWLGELLQSLLSRIWRDPEGNTRETLEDWIRTMDREAHSGAVEEREV